MRFDRLVRTLRRGRWLAVATWLASCGPAAAAPLSPGCLPNPLPADAVAPAPLDTVVLDERLRLSVWRHACADGTGSAILMRAAPASAAPWLCSGDFALVQGGLSHNAVLRATADGARLCGELTAPTTVVLDAASGPAIAFDRVQAFTLAFAGWDAGEPRSFSVAVPSAVDVPVALAAAVLPGSRSVQVGLPATAFATIIASGLVPAERCRIVPTGVPGTFQFWRTDSANQVVGGPDPDVTIPAGQAQTFLIAFTPSETFPATTVQFDFDCDNTPSAPVVQGVNTLLLSAAAEPVPDVVALAATPTNDGIAHLPGASATAAFAVATVNVGAAGRVVASVDTGGAVMPIALSLCQTDPTTAQCVSGIGPAVAVDIGTGQTPTFTVFVKASGEVPFDPAVHRAFVRFEDRNGLIRGATSIAIRTP